MAVVGSLLIVGGGASIFWIGGIVGNLGHAEYSACGDLYDPVVCGQILAEEKYWNQVLAFVFLAMIAGLVLCIVAFVINEIRRPSASVPAETESPPSQFR
jgi:hypothetical protein